MMFRNPEVRRACTLAVLLGGMSAALTGFLVARADTSAAPTVAAAGCVAAAVCTLIPLLAATRARYRAISRMSDRLDAVLNGGRSLDFRSIGEGELSILSSELDRVITRLDATVEELEREKRALADALADISHQLKTPLTSIALSTELIRTRLAEAETSPDLIERVRLVQRLQGRVEELVATLLKLARIDAGVVKLTRIPVRAGALIDAATEALAIAFDIAGVQLELDVDQQASFTGDPNWSAEALGNVLKNCLEHTGAGGQVRIRAWEDALACRLRITDTGGGIADADLPHIFERFYRGQARTGESSEVNPAGIGIGLSLAKSLVAAQGGSLFACNRTDETGAVIGAQFDFVFFKAVV